MSLHSSHPHHYYHLTPNTYNTMASTNNDNDNLDIRSDTSEKSYVAIETTRNPDGSDVPDEDLSASGAESDKRDGNESIAESARATATPSAETSNNAGLAVTTSTKDDDAHFDIDPLEPENDGVYEEYHMRKTDRKKSFPTATGSKSSR